MNIPAPIWRRIERSMVDIIGMAGDLGPGALARHECLALEAAARDFKDSLARLRKKAPKKTLAEPLRKQLRNERRHKALCVLCHQKHHEGSRGR